MFRARQRLTGNDVTSAYLRRMLTTNARLTLLANFVSLSRLSSSLTCITNRDVMPAVMAELAHSTPREQCLVMCAVDLVVNGSCILATNVYVFGILNSKNYT